ncbi:retrovirus-related pol polyprotein from transposon TNT 1-94 [Tanacetum coccineum]
MEVHYVNLELKYQNQALKFGQHGHILNETSNKAKIKMEKDVLETINIELEHSVAKLLAENEHLNKQSEHLKQTYKDLYDSIKKTRVQTKDHNDSLIAQVNNLDKTWFSPNKASVLYEKTSPRSCLRWKPTGRIFNTVGLRWVPTGKIFTSSTIKVDNEPPNGSNEHITNPYECKQTLNVNAGTLNLSAGTSYNPKKERLRTTLQAPLLKEKKDVCFSALYLQKKRNLLVFEHSHQQFAYFPMLVQSSSGSTTWPKLVTHGITSSGLPMFDEYFNPLLSVASPVPVAAAPRPVDPTGIPSSTTIDQDAPSISTSQTPQETQSPVIPSGVEEHFHDTKVAHLNNDPFFGVPILEPNPGESFSRDVIPTNVLLVNQPPKHLRKCTKDHPLDNVIRSPSRPNYKDALKESYWIKAMQEELNKFEGLKLKKALYGLKHSPWAWYALLSSFLLSQKFSKGKINHTLFTQKEGKDILLMSMMGKMPFFLGVQNSQSPRGIFLNQSKYALKIIKNYGMETSDLVDTPMVEKSKLDEDP